ncbi:MAG: heme biosynthesis HemY N-terminal domain-containing protein [Methylococcaceae bacterium]|nr:heme biosynthesis HemY N-terminal domain-containing protein [Methylococcaceae bacterium]
MKRVLLVLIGLVAGLGAALLLLRYIASHNGSGYVIVGMGQWSLETSLLVASSALLLVFILLYAFIRLFITAVRLPTLLKQRGHELRNKRSQEALITGLIETAEGNWEKAEKQLIRHAANSGIPLINYLTAARAAHSRGAHEQRDEYLKLAHESMPEAELAIGLTKAELQLSDQQFEGALDGLIQLNKIAPGHAAVLKMMHQAYARIEDWEGLSRIIPKLHANKVMLEAEIKLLETETYSALIKKKAQTREAGPLRDLWLDVPEHIRALSGIQQLYFAAMIEAGAEAEVEPKVREAIGKEWSETLLVLYGCIKMPDVEQQLSVAESWLGAHSGDAVLLRLLGKLSLRAGRLEKAKAYLESSLKADLSVEAYQLLGDVLMKQNDPVNACQFFRNGLLFASNEVVAQIEQFPLGDLPQEEPEPA